MKLKMHAKNNFKLKTDGRSQGETLSARRSRLRSDSPQPGARRNGSNRVGRLGWPKRTGRPEAIFSRNPGQGMLVAILMITAAALAIALAVATISSSEVNISQVARQATRADALARGCLEDALMRLARTDSSQPPSFTIQDGNCTIKITGTGTAFEITSTAQVGRAYRKIMATVNVNDEVLTVQKWEETY